MSRNTLANGFSSAECAQLTGLFTRLEVTDGGLVAGHFDLKVRQSTLAWLPESKDLAWLDTRMARIATDANQQLFGYALEAGLFNAVFTAG
jgi:hypothetical protein